MWGFLLSERQPPVVGQQPDDNIVTTRTSLYEDTDKDRRNVLKTTPTDQFGPMYLLGLTPEPCC